MRLVFWASFYEKYLGALHVIRIDVNAVNLALVAFSRYNTMDGNLFVFIITVAAAEVAVGLAIIVALYRKRQTVMVDELNFGKLMSWMLQIHYF